MGTPFQPVTIAADSNQTAFVGVPIVTWLRAVPDRLVDDSNEPTPPLPDPDATVVVES